MENPSRLEWFYTLPDFQDCVGRSSAAERICWRVSRRAKDNVLRRYRQLGNDSEALLAFALYEDLVAADRGEAVRENWTAFLSRHAESASKSLVRRSVANRIDIPLISGSSSTVKELMLVCFRFISEPDRFFTNFSCSETSNCEVWFAILYGYCKRKIEGQLIDEIRTWEGSKTFMRSGLGLISRSTEKRIVDAAVFYGIGSPQLEEYIFIWRCFKEAKDAKQIDIKSPKDAEYQTIADLANRRGSGPEMRQEGSVVDADSVKGYLAKLGEALRYYIDRPQVSIDAPLSSGNSSSLGDLLPDEDVDLDEELEGANTSLSLVELARHIHNYLDKVRQARKGIIKCHWATLLLLEAVELTQQEVAEIANCTQKTVSKRNKAIWEKLLSEVREMSWLPERAPLDITSEVIEARLKEVVSSIIRGYFITLLRTEICSLPARTSELLLTQSEEHERHSCPDRKHQLLALLQDCFTLTSLFLEPEVARKLEEFVESTCLDESTG